MSSNGPPHRGVGLDVPVSTSVGTTTLLPAGGHVERVDVLGGPTGQVRQRHA
jgi:hypothetical protein